MGVGSCSENKIARPVRTGHGLCPREPFGNWRRSGLRPLVLKESTDKHPDPEGPKHRRLLMPLHPKPSHVNGKRAVHVLPELWAFGVPRWGLNVFVAPFLIGQRRRREWVLRLRIGRRLGHNDWKRSGYTERCFEGRAKVAALTRGRGGNDTPCRGQARSTNRPCFTP